MIPNRLREIDWALGLLAEARRNPKDKSVIHGNGLSLGAGKVLKAARHRHGPYAPFTSTSVACHRRG
jgi:hypothetical protein